MQYHRINAEVGDEECEKDVGGDDNVDGDAAGAGELRLSVGDDILTLQVMGCCWCHTTTIPSPIPNNCNAPSSISEALHTQSNGVNTICTRTRSLWSFQHHGWLMLMQSAETENQEWEVVKIAGKEMREIWREHQKIWRELENSRIRESCTPL